MSSIEVRPFRRCDREQLTALVNAHAAAVVPGSSVSVNTSALLGEEVVGYVEVEGREDAGRRPRHGGWADIGNLHVVETHRRRGVGAWLVGQAAEWLQLARIDRVLEYAWPEQEGCRAFLRKMAFRELTRTRRGWRRTP